MLLCLFFPSTLHSFHKTWLRYFTKLKILYFVDCSCAEDCEWDESCCFVKVTEKADDETCLYPRSKKRDIYTHISSSSFEIAYFTVTKVPPGGCVEGHADSCNLQVLSLLPPVFSNETNKLYLNRDCAICHGVKEFIEYESYLTCDPLGGSTPVDFAKDLTSFFENQTASNCFLGYLSSGLPGDDPRTCLVHASKPVEDNFGSPNAERVDFLYNMSNDDIKEACESTFYSPTFSYKRKAWYPNPFCLAFEEGKPDKLQCYLSDSNAVGVDYLALLDPTVKEILQGNAKLSYIDRACFGEDTTIDRVPYLCPLPISYI